MSVNQKPLLPLGFVLLLLLPVSSAALSVSAVFNQSGVAGSITFSQESPDASTAITVSLRGGCVVRDNKSCVSVSFPS